MIAQLVRCEDRSAQTHCRVIHQHEALAIVGAFAFATGGHRSLVLSVHPRQAKVLQPTSATARP